jgi:hypothetical protein
MAIEQPASAKAAAASANVARSGAARLLRQILSR